MDSGKETALIPTSSRTGSHLASWLIKVYLSDHFLCKLRTIRPLKVFQ